MKKNGLLLLLAVGAGATLALAACGRPSTDNRFGFDGSGDPTYPAGNIIHGKYAGSVEITQFKSYETCGVSATKSCYGGLFSNLDDLYVSQGVFNQVPIEGLAGLPLLVIHAATPPRTMGACYTNLNISPESGTLDWLDVGDVTIPYPSVAQPGQKIGVPMPRNTGSHAGPQYDPLYYFGAYDASTNPTDTGSVRAQVAGLDSSIDLTMQWNGGTFGAAGYPTAPPRVDKTTEVAHQPPVLANLMVNGTAMGSIPTIGTQSSYTVTWTPWTTTRAQDHQYGVSITAQVYGPADLSGNGSTDVEDWPWFNTLGEVTCVAPDSSGAFTLQQSAIDNLVAAVKLTKQYARSTKDSNHDGVISPWSCTGGLNGAVTCSGEDANGDGHDDKILGVALIVNRRTESSFTGCVKGVSSNECARQAPIFVSGNDLHVARMKTYQPQ